jgi:EpsI family protein
MFLALPNVTLEVAEACSGVNYLIAVVAVGIPVAFLSMRGWTRRASLLVWAVLMAILANGLRVALIGVLAYYDVGGALHGPGHVLHGVFVSFLGFGALFAGAWVLSERPEAAGPHRAAAPSQRDLPAQPAGASTSRRNWWGLTVLFLGVGFYLQLGEPSAVSLTRDLQAMPMQIGEWVGRDVATSPDYPYRLREVDRELSRIYQREGAPPVRLSVGYFEVQRDRKELVTGEARRFYRSTEAMEVALGGRGRVSVRGAVTGEGSQRTLVVYWYDLNGEIVTHPLLAQAHVAWDVLRHRRSNGALVAFAVPLGGHDDAASGLAEVRRFLEEGAVVLEQWLPGPRSAERVAA